MKSVFIKYMTAFAVIILISFLMLSSIISVSIDDYASDAKKKDVTLLSKMVSTLITGEYGKEDMPLLSDFIVHHGETISHLFTAMTPYTEDISFLITDMSGTVLFTDVHTAGIQDVTQVPSFYVLSIAEAEDDVFSALSDMDNTLGTPHLICGSTIRDRTGVVVGAVFACASNTSADALIQIMNQSITLANLWVMLAVMIAVYFITERLLNPLREMSRAAKEFAMGNFNTRIQVAGSDEIAEFAVTFNHMAESLSQQEALRSTFLANVSHDLRTPMTTIAGYVDSILDGAIPPERQAHYLRIVSGEIHRLSRLVSQLLDISRMEAGMRKLSPTTFDICEVARLILISFESKIEQKKLRVEFVCEQERMPAYADRDAIHQVIYNLCENAIKFSYEGGLLRLSITPGEQGKYLIRIYNEGSGVSAEDLPYIFDRFYKSDKSRGLDKLGVGLGLYIVKTMLNAAGESVRAESEEGRYCAFEFTICRAD